MSQFLDAQYFECMVSEGRVIEYSFQALFPNARLLEPIDMEELALGHFFTDSFLLNPCY